MSDRQWRDVVAVLAVNAGSLDETHLDRWAEDLGVTDLLARARGRARRRRRSFGAPPRRIPQGAVPGGSPSTRIPVVGGRGPSRRLPSPSPPGWSIRSMRSRGTGDSPSRSSSKATRSISPRTTRPATSPPPFHMDRRGGPTARGAQGEGDGGAPERPHPPPRRQTPCLGPFCASRAENGARRARDARHRETARFSVDSVWRSEAWVRRRPRALSSYQPSPGTCRRFSPGAG